LEGFAWNRFYKEYFTQIHNKIECACILDMCTKYLIKRVEKNCQVINLQRIRRQLRAVSVHVKNGGFERCGGFVADRLALWRKSRRSRHKRRNEIVLSVSCQDLFEDRALQAASRFETILPHLVDGELADEFRRIVNVAKDEEKRRLLRLRLHLVLRVGVEVRRWVEGHHQVAPEEKLV